MTTQKLLPLMGAIALLAAVPALASAHTHVFLGINLGGLFAPPPVVYAPPPVAYAPPPPPVVYVPRPRYDYYAQPAYYAPGAYYGGPVYIQRRGWRDHDHWDHDHGDHGRWDGWHHDHGDDDDDQ